METTRRKTRAALCAAAIRVELKKNFPGVKFTVHCQNYSGGDSVDVDYTDGPPTKAVEAFTSKYQYGHFDGMIDYYEISNRREDIPQTKYLFVKRELSPAIREKYAAEVRAEYGIADTVGVNDYLGEKYSFRDINEQIWRQYEKYDTRTEPRQCDGYECPNKSRELTLQADDRSLCQHCDWKAHKNDPPKPTPKACKHPGCDLTDKGHEIIPTDHSFRETALTVIKGGLN